MRGATSVPVWIPAALAAMFAVAAPASAQDSVLGTFTVNGKTTRFTNVYATMETSPIEASEKYLMLLVTNVPVGPATDRPTS